MVCIFSVLPYRKNITSTLVWCIYLFAQPMEETEVNLNFGAFFTHCKNALTDLMVCHLKTKKKPQTKTHKRVAS